MIDPRPVDFRQLPDLALRSAGGAVLHADDEAFAAKENLINPGLPVFDPAQFGSQGKIYDGWETRRRRTPGFDGEYGADGSEYDAVVVRLAVPGVLAGVVVDTAYFTGNYPPEVAVDGLCAVDAGDPPVDPPPDPPPWQQDGWQPLVPRSSVAGDTANAFPVTHPGRITHVRLRIFPDGGVARLRVHGWAVPDPRPLDALGTFDLAAAEHGGLVTDCSNLFYGSAGNLLLPGPARSMGEGWETARRRDDGNDWVEVALACEATLSVAELDTGWFLHNAPGWAQLSGRVGDGPWRPLLPRVPLRADTRQRFLLAGAGSGTPAGDAGAGAVAAGAVDAVRLDVHPDGGMARLRLYGRPTAAGRAALGLRWFDALPAAAATAVLTGAGADPDAAARAVAERPVTAGLSSTGPAAAGLGERAVALVTGSPSATP